MTKSQAHIGMDCLRSALIAGLMFSAAACSQAAENTERADAAASGVTPARAETANTVAKAQDVQASVVEEVQTTVTAQADEAEAAVVEETAPVAETASQAADTAPEVAQMAPKAVEEVVQAAEPSAPQVAEAAAPQVAEAAAPQVAEAAAPQVAETTTPQVAEATSQADDVAASEEAVIVAVSGDAEAGAAAFAVCRACHSVDEGRNGLGPTLAGVVGRPVGSVDGFNYSDAMKATDIVWTPENLDMHLKDSESVVPGNRMTQLFRGGVQDDTKRADIIAYLATQ